LITPALQRGHHCVIPAQAGIDGFLFDRPHKSLDSRLRGNDGRKVRIFQDVIPAKAGIQ
jgi:hypothetical protein